MGSRRDFVSRGDSVDDVLEVGLRLQFAICIRAERHDVLRQLLERLRWGLDVASLFRERGVGSVCEWDVGMVSGCGLLLGVAISLGMDSVSLWIVGILSQCGLGLDARRFVVRREQRRSTHSFG